MKKASVIIPAYNEEKYLKKTLKSINHPDAEVIVVCNGCTDNTKKIAKEFAHKIVELKEKGVSKARNTGASVATGGVLIFLDADIELTKDTIQKIIDSSYKLGTCKAKPNVNKIVPKFLMKVKSYMHYFGFTTGVLFCDKRLFNKIKGFDEDRHKREWWDLIKKAKKYTKHGVVNSYVINNMRRFEKKGYKYVMLYWIKEFFLKNNEPYESVR